MKQITKFFDVGTEGEAKIEVQKEVKNWSWLDFFGKAKVVEEATFERRETKYGPLYIARFMSDIK